MTKAISTLWLSAAVLFSLAGVAGFVILFVRDMNVFWFILSPLIFAVYQIPAIVVFFLRKKRLRRDAREETGEELPPANEGV